MKWKTVQLTTITHKKLAAIATVLERSMAGQLRFWVDREFDRLQKEGYIGPGVLTELKKEVEG